MSWNKTNSKSLEEKVARLKISNNKLREIVKNKDKEIEKLKAIVEEAIRKPMGVEPHSWSDYKMLKDKQC